MSKQYPVQPDQSHHAGPQPQQPQVVYVEKKKKHRFRNFVGLPVVGLIALIGIIAAATSGGGDSTTPSASTGGGPAKNTAPEDRGQPRPVTLGEAFTIGKHQFNAGWTMEHEQYLGSKLTGMVTNVSNDTSTAFFHVKFLKGTTVLANFQCSTDDLEPKQTQAIECLNTVTTTNRVTGYDKVTAEATF